MPHVCSTSRQMVNQRALKSFQAVTRLTEIPATMTRAFFHGLMLDRHLSLGTSFPSGNSTIPSLIKTITVEPPYLKYPFSSPFSTLISWYLQLICFVIAIIASTRALAALTTKLNLYLSFLEHSNKN